jgi:hypothetical protein
MATATRQPMMPVTTATVIVTARGGLRRGGLSSSTVSTAAAANTLAVCPLGYTRSPLSVSCTRCLITNSISPATATALTRASSAPLNRRTARQATTIKAVMIVESSPPPRLDVGVRRPVWEPKWPRKKESTGRSSAFGREACTDTTARTTVIARQHQARTAAGRRSGRGRSGRAGARSCRDPSTLRPPHQPGGSAGELPV